MSDKVLQQDLSEKAPNRPQMLIAQLLFREKPEACSFEKAKSAVEKYCGEIGEIAEKPDILMFPVNRYKAMFEDKPDGRSCPQGVPVLACFMQPFEFKMELDELTRSQLWDMENGAEFADEVRYEVVVHAMLSDALSYTEQAELFIKQLDAAVEMYPTCDAIYVTGSGKLTPTEKFISDRQWDMGARFINAAVNVRFFNIQGTGDMLIDSLGMYTLALPDVQMHFRDINPNDVVRYVYNILDYQFKNDFPIDNGDSLDGIGSDGNIDINVQWRARYEDSLVQPLRPVLDINCGEFAAGTRE
ncbi:MAG: DUF4261 domain-containing protein [Oscillospiraceae bacterium]|nr:DUF4261 domain-containing protein [Oscillospiraceae bacterium]